MGTIYKCDFHGCEETVEIGEGKAIGWDTIYYQIYHREGRTIVRTKDKILCPKHIRMLDKFIEGGLLAFDK